MNGECPQCGSWLGISRVTCNDCALSLEGDLATPRLYRLNAEEQHFVELFVTASGSLKEMSALLNVSYPTVRNRLDTLIAKLQAARQEDDARKVEILEDIEAGRITAKRGMRMINNL